MRPGGRRRRTIRRPEISLKAPRMRRARKYTGARP